MSNEIQFLQEKRTKIELGTKTRNKLLTIGIVALALVLAASSVLTYLKSNLTSEIAQIDSDLDALEARRDKKFEGELLVVRKQLGLISSLLDNHIYWSNTLTKIENLLQGQVQVKNLGLDKSLNEVKLGGVAASYSTIAKQIAAFLSDDSIEDVILEGAEVKPTGIEITMKLKLKSKPAPESETTSESQNGQ